MFIEVNNEDVNFLDRQYAESAALNNDFADRPPSLKVKKRKHLPQNPCTCNYTAIVHNRTGR
jgi:hypothetical protein